MEFLSPSAVFPIGIRSSFPSMKTILPRLLFAPAVQANVSIDYALVGDTGNMADTSG